MIESPKELREEWKEFKEGCNWEGSRLSINEIADWWLEKITVRDAELGEVIRNSRTVEETFGIGVREETARMQVLVDLKIINKINTEK